MRKKSSRILSFVYSSISRQYSIYSSHITYCCQHKKNMQMRCGPPGKSGNIHFQIKYLKKVLSIKPDNCTLFSYFKALKEMKPCVQLFLYPKYFYIIGGDVTLILSTKSNKNFSVTERDAFLLCLIYLYIKVKIRHLFCLNYLPI